MLHFRSFIHNLGEMTYTLLVFLLDAARFLMLCLRPAPTLAAEDLLLQKHLRGIKSDTSHLGVLPMPLAWH
jgi:hypothetical protein